jgi:hypothetical protein
MTGGIAGSIKFDWGRTAAARTAENERPDPNSS